MKNLLLIIAGLAVGYGVAYYSVSKKWAPFDKPTAETPDSSKMEKKMAVKMSGQSVMTEISESEAKSMSANYANWIADLAKKAGKGMKPKDLKDQNIFRGGKISKAELSKIIEEIKGDEINYVFGKKPASSAVYLMLMGAATDGGSSPMPTATKPNVWTPIDTASMCPPICPIWPGGPIVWPGPVPMPPGK